jgi:hypothetical protein
VSENRITLVISPEQNQLAAAGVAQTFTALPGLVSVDPSQTRDLYPFVNKNETFGRGVLRTLEAHPQIVPPSLDVAGARADLDALDTLRPLLEAVQRLHSQLEDTVRLLGHDVMDFAYEGYQQLKLSGAAHGLEEMRRELGQQFSRPRRRQEGAPPAA